jgi:hypothetical protein
MEANAIPVVSFAEDATNLHTPQQLSSIKVPKNGSVFDYNCGSEEQAAGALNLHSFERSTPWKEDMKSKTSEMEQTHIPGTKKDGFNNEGHSSECIRNKISRQTALLPGTIADHCPGHEDSDPTNAALKSPRTFSHQPDDLKSSHADPQSRGSNHSLLLALGALGVIFGDIGTSPLYTVQTVFLNIPTTPDNVIGAISSIFWLLNIIVTLKYVIVIMSSDNQGEGGIMALTTLASQSSQSTQPLARPWWYTITMMIGELPSRPSRL